MIIETVLVLTTLYIIWYHRGRFQRKVNYYHDLASAGLVGMDDVNWMRDLLGLAPGWMVK